MTTKKETIFCITPPDVTPGEFMDFFGELPRPGNRSIKWHQGHDEPTIGQCPNCGLAFCDECDECWGKETECRGCQHPLREGEE